MPGLARDHATVGVDRGVLGAEHRRARLRGRARPALVTARLAVLVILAVGGFVTELRRPGRSGSRAEVSAGGIVIILAAVLLGPFAAGVVGFAELLRDARRPPLARWLAHAPLRCLIALAAGAAATSVGHGGAGDTKLLACGSRRGRMTVVDIAGNGDRLPARHRGRQVPARLPRRLLPAVRLSPDRLGDGRRLPLGRNRSAGDGAGADAARPVHLPPLPAAQPGLRRSHRRRASASRSA